MSGRLEGKIALVSGASQGFGRGILETFIREGASVLALDLQATDGLIDGYTEKQAYQIMANVTEESSWKKAVRQPSPSLIIVTGIRQTKNHSSSKRQLAASESRPPSSSTTPAGPTPTNRPSP